MLMDGSCDGRDPTQELLKGIDRRGERVFAGDPITRKTDRALSKGVDMVVLLSRGKNRGCHREGG